MACHTRLHGEVEREEGGRMDATVHGGELPSNAHDEGARSDEDADQTQGNAILARAKLGMQCLGRDKTSWNGHQRNGRCVRDVQQCAS